MLSASHTPCTGCNPNYQENGPQKPPKEAVPCSQWEQGSLAEPKRFPKTPALHKPNTSEKLASAGDVSKELDPHPRQQQQGTVVSHHPECCQGAGLRGEHPPDTEPTGQNEVLGCTTRCFVDMGGSARQHSPPHWCWWAPPGADPPPCPAASRLAHDREVGIGGLDGRLNVQSYPFDNQAV